MPDTYRDRVGVQRCSACLRELTDCMCEPHHPCRAMQRLLAAAGAAVPLDAIDAWTQPEVDDAHDWAVAQIAAHEKDRPGHSTSVRWPDHVSAATLHSPKGSEPMAKKAKRSKVPAHRVNTHRTNGAASTSRQVAPPGRPRRPRQADLPGTEDRAIKPLEDIAAAYADVRDRRIELNKEEAELKAHALKLMHKFDKTIYRRHGVEIRLIEGEEDVKVKVKKPGEAEDDQAAADDTGGDQVDVTNDDDPAGDEANG